MQLVITILCVVSREDHTNADCLACVLLTHGDRGDVIYATNGTLELHSIIDMFKPDRCPTLAGKPKLFFIQVCAIAVTYNDTTLLTL